MSASLLLDGTGKIATQYIPASVLPNPNPEFESLAIVPATGDPGYLSVENDAGNVTALQKNADGSFEVLQSIAPASFVSMLLVADDCSSVTLGNATGETDDIVLQCSQTITADAPTVELGNGAGTPSVVVAGGSGNGTVYDTRYNFIGSGGIGLNPSYPAADNLATGTPLSGTFVATRTGPHQVSFQVQLIGGSTIGADRLVFQFEAAQTPTSFNVLASQLAYSATPGVSNVFTFNGTTFLTAGVTYNWSMTAYGAGWSVPVFASVWRQC